MVHVDMYGTGKETTMEEQLFVGNELSGIYSAQLLTKSEQEYSHATVSYDV